MTPTTRNRLTALLIGAIYRIANALFPLIDTIVQQPTRPWIQRKRYADRFSHIIQQLLSLTARIRPQSIRRNPTFPQTTQPPALAPTQSPRPTTPRPQAPARLLSARQFATRLAILLRQLEQLAAEIGAALPQTILRNVARARTIAGCDALPPKIKSWERAG